MPTKDPAKLKAIRARYYRKRRAQAIEAAKANYRANRQDRIDYAHHHRSVRRNTSSERHAEMMERLRQIAGDR